jgi:flagellar biosynthetic protein FlhB
VLPRGPPATGLLIDLASGVGLIALVDTPLALVRHTAKLRMTKQEVRDEAKEQDGNPETKGAQRRRMREARRGPATAAVASAHVVLTNPTHFAVALRYRRAEDRAPVVVARGRGQIAAAIRAAALEHALPVLEYPELARALYFTGREGAEIAPDLYAAVAAVLAFVFNLDRATRARLPSVEVPISARFDEHGRRAL